MLGMQRTNGCVFLLKTQDPGLVQRNYQAAALNQRTHTTKAFATCRCGDKRMYSFKEGLEKLRGQRFSINYQALISVYKIFYKTPTFLGSWEDMTLAMMCFFPKIPVVRSLGMRCQNKLNLVLCGHHINSKTLITESQHRSG